MTTNFQVLQTNYDNFHFHQAALDEIPILKCIADPDLCTWQGREDQLKEEHDGEYYYKCCPGCDNHDPNNFERVD